VERIVEKYSRTLFSCKGCIEIDGIMCKRFEESVAMCETRISFGVCWFKIKTQGINK